MEAGEGRGASGMVAAVALAMLIVLIFTLSANGAFAPIDTGVHITFTR